MVLKRISVSGTAALLALAIGETACGGPSEPEARSWLRASVAAPEKTVEFSGTAQFGLGTDPSGIQRFELAAWEIRSGHRDFIVFDRSNAGRPSVGQYELEIPRNGGKGNFAGIYVRTTQDGAAQENYTATSGWLRITYSASDRLEGEFGFTAELYCTYDLLAPDHGGADCDRNRPIRGASSLMVTGSFSAGLPDKDAIRTDPLRFGVS